MLVASTLVEEILIVVIILGIFAAIAIPQFTNASNDACNNSVASTLQTARSQIELFKIWHADTPPLQTAMWAIMLGKSTTTERRLEAHARHHRPVWPVPPAGRRPNPSTARVAVTPLCRCRDRWLGLHHQYEQRLHLEGCGHVRHDGSDLLRRLRSETPASPVAQCTCATGGSFMVRFSNVFFASLTSGNCRYERYRRLITICFLKNAVHEDNSPALSIARPGEVRAAVVVDLPTARGTKRMRLRQFHCERYFRQLLDDVASVQENKKVLNLEWTAIWSSNYLEQRSRAGGGYSVPAVDSVELPGKPALSPSNPMPFHGVNILLHALVTVLGTTCWGVAVERLPRALVAL